jgi:ABC-type transport system substrate-binding protein
MSKRFFKISILLLTAVLLSGCLPAMPAYSPPAFSDPLTFDEPPETVDQAPALTATAHGRFTLRYAPENTMNPILALNRDNISLTSLIYESLFILDDNLVAHPLLCADWHTEDNITFTFEIYPDIPMHDGSMLTADDVSYSINNARRRGRHMNKLQSIESVGSDGELTVTIVIDSPSARFIRLLDIPIIKNGSIEERIPPGTGPYIFPSPEAMRLNRFAMHRDYSNMPLPVIYLRACNDSELTYLFDEGELSLLWDDPTGAFDIRLNRDHEPRYYNTTSLQYLGFNTLSTVMRSPDVRRAIGCAIDRQFIVENIMNVTRSRQTVAAHVAIHPFFDLYDPTWEHRGQDPLREMDHLIERVGLIDFYEDGTLDMPDGVGGYFKFTLDFIVNIENAHKLAAAERIAESLRQVGFDTNVRVLPWSNFLQALEDGNFDLYYGETQLGADFDFSPLLLPGDRNLNFGRTANTQYQSLIRGFLAAETEEEVSIAGRQLNQAIIENAPFIPILYKRHAIYSPMGVVMGATPSQSGVFHNFHKWAIDLEMLT